MKSHKLFCRLTAGVLAAATAFAVAGCSSADDGGGEESSPILSVKAIGIVDTDGPKVGAVALEYGQDMAGAELSEDTYTVSLYKAFEAVYFSDGAIGDITNIYVNDSAEWTENGGSGSGNYVILEVFTDYIACSELNFMNTMTVSVTQDKDIKLANGESIAKSAVAATNTVTTETVNEVTGKVTKTTKLADDGYVIPDIEGFQFYTDTPGNYGADGAAFYWEHCFDQRDGLYYDEHLAYALWVPEDWHEDGNYAMVTLENPAAAAGTHPLTAVLQTRSPAVYASEWAQELVKKTHGVDGMIVVVPVVTERVDDNGGTTAEYEAVVHLWDYLIEKYSVNEDYIYGSGQSIGGMILIETQRNRDNFFAGLMLYEDQWAQNYYPETLFVRNMAANEKTAATADMHYSRTDDYITWDYHYGNDGEKVGVDQGHDPYNLYYLVSDDNILVLHADTNNLAVDTWNEMSYLYEDLTGNEGGYNGINRFTLSLGSGASTYESENAALQEFLAGDKEGTRNINEVIFSGGWSDYNHRLYDATYEWLLTQSRQTEMSRAKLDINKPFEAAEEQIQTEERAIYFTDAAGNTLYHITGKKGAGTQFYNTGWYNLLTVADAAPGWLPDDLGNWISDGTAKGWTDGITVTGANIVGATLLDGGAAVAIEYSQDMTGVHVNLVGDGVYAYGSDEFRTDISIVVAPFAFFDGDGEEISCSITNVYVNSLPARVNGAARQSGEGRYIIVEFAQPLAATPVSVVQRTTLYTDGYVLASALPWKYAVA